MNHQFADEHRYYQLQTSNTDPCRYAYYFSDVSDDITEIFRVSRNVIEHHAGINTGKIPLDRYPEMEIDRIEDILAKIASNGVENIVDPIPLDKKVIGNCFNISKLAVAIMRAKGIPSRIRYAYCSYFYPDFCHEQAIVEYWDQAIGKWRRGDASMNYEILDHLGIKVDIDLLNVSIDKSIPIADVWLGCRKGDLDFSDYGASISTRKRGGLGHVAHKLTQDLACLNNLELMDCDFIAPPRNYLRSKNLNIKAFDNVAEVLNDLQYPNFKYGSKQLPFCAVPRRILRKSRFTGVNVRQKEII